MPLVHARTVIVESGQANACIVIADEPPRMVGLAAEELQIYLEKISGTRYEILGNTRLTHGLRNVHGGRRCRRPTLNTML